MIIGVSPDAPAVNLAFSIDQELPFTLLSDIDGRVARAYGAGRQAGSRLEHLPQRRTFIIDPTGVVSAVYDVADVDLHAGEVLDDLNTLAKGTKL